MRINHIKSASWLGKYGLAFVALVVALMTMVSTASATLANAATPSTTSEQITSSAIKPGSVKHVWLIILENKSYDATFTGLNQNTYLWKTLPSQGALLTQYYGTGHSSQDNYISLVSGQGPSQDLQDDCSETASQMSDNAHVYDGKTTLKDKNGEAIPAPDGAVDKGQAASLAGPNQGDGANGCVLPDQVPTLFNQFDDAGVTWKGYAQDLGSAAGRDGSNRAITTTDVTGTPLGTVNEVGKYTGTSCGFPGDSGNGPVSDPTDINGSTNSSGTVVPSMTGATKGDQYVAKHFPLPFFESLTGDRAAGINPLTAPTQGGYDCDSNHVANLDSADNGLLKDLTSEKTTPAFSWITPDNCSDAHDATCKGSLAGHNNLSGSFITDSKGALVPNYGTASNPVTDPAAALTNAAAGLVPNPQAPAPKNTTGGLYSADLFLQYYIPLIEASPAFKDNGLIDITFDEANPPYSYTGNSFVNADDPGSKDPNTQDGTVSNTGQAAQKNFISSDDNYVGAKSSLLADKAGQTVNGKGEDTEPTGLNSTLLLTKRATDGKTVPLGPGPGNDGFLDRPAACPDSIKGEKGALYTPTDTSDKNYGCEIGLVMPSSVWNDMITSPSSKMPLTAVDGDTTGTWFVNNSVNGDWNGDGKYVDPNGTLHPTGRIVTFYDADGNQIKYAEGPGVKGVFVGQTVNGRVIQPADGTTKATGAIQLVDSTGESIKPPTGAVSYQMSATCQPNADFTGCLNPALDGVDSMDSTYDQDDPTPGGGDSGSVLISPLIKPGTVSSVKYNHYSWLRTMEDLFQVSKGKGTQKLAGGVTVSGGVDGQGHLGFAAQAGLDTFGTDVFTNAPAQTPEPTVKSVPVYRLYNKNSGEHLYTVSGGEKNSLTKLGWRYEGTLESAPSTGKPVYRLFNPNAKGGDHYYTTSKTEGDGLVKKGWKYDFKGKADFYAGGTVKVYVAYNPHAKSGAHNYTTNNGEQKKLLGLGWKYGAVAWTAMAAGKAE